MVVTRDSYINRFKSEAYVARLIMVPYAQYFNVYSANFLPFVCNFCCDIEFCIAIFD